MTLGLRRLSVFAFAAAALTSFAGCPSCAPGTVGEGIARLTVRNVGAMVSAVNADDSCGFASSDVLAGATVSGNIGSEGTVTFTVTDCEVDLGESSVISEDCTDGTVTGSGKVTISATRTIGGILTGNADSPVVPGGPDAVTITITSATFDNFEVVNSKSDNVLTMVTGSISAVVKPRLAVAASSGACAVATPNVTFSDIVYGESTVHVKTPDNDFDADVTTSDISAQNGVNGGEENSISGTMTVFGSDVDVTGDGVLDADYDAADFTAAYACTPDLATPESYICAELTPRLADGAGRLSIKMLGTIASLLEADSSCGFSATAVQQAATLDGTPGGSGALTMSVTDCTLSFPAMTTLDADCSGTSTIVQGSVTVSATKVLSGRVTGSAEKPIVPITDQPAVIELSVVTDDFRVGSTANVNALTAYSGTLAGTVSPQVYVGADTGVCSVSTPNAGFDDVSWTSAELLLTSASGSFALDVGSAALVAANGSSASGTNALSGSLTIDGNVFNVPSDAAGLDPDFTQAGFDAAWQCNSALADPLSHQCGAAMTGVLAGGSAALTMRTLGTVVSLVNADTSCGFGSAAVGGTPTFAGGELGDDDTTVTFALAGGGCTISFAEPTVIATDCLGNTTTVSGSVVVTGSKSVVGFRTGDPYAPVVPTSFKAATFDLVATFTDFSVTSSASTSSLTVSSGSLSGVVNPRAGLDTTTGACSIATPNLSFANVAWADADASLLSDGARFDFTLDQSALAAQNGSDLTETNTLSGSITVDGAAVSGLALPLDPAFDQATFDSTYSCTPNLALVPDAACSFRQVLGNAAARLLVKAGAVAAKVVDGSSTCGFADVTPDTAPVVTGTPGGPGSIEQTADANCGETLPPAYQLAIDCLGNTTHASGTFAAATATKTVNGVASGSNPPIYPVARDAAHLALNGVQFTGWNVYDQAPSAGAIAAALTVTGTASVTVDPVAGRGIGASTAAGFPIYSISTPVAAIGVTMASGTLVVQSGSKTFNVAVTDVDVDAFAGAWVDGGSNDVAGTLTVDGEPVTIAAGSPLVTSYDQAIFDSTYVCTPDLGEVVNAN